MSNRWPLPTPNRNLRNAVELTQQRHRLFNDLIGVRFRREGLSRKRLANIIGTGWIYIERFERDPEAANPSFDWLLRYAYGVGARIKFEVELIEPLPASENRGSNG